jgi:hypothetical protein
MDLWLIKQPKSAESDIDMSEQPVLQQMVLVLGEKKSQGIWFY